MTISGDSLTDASRRKLITIIDSPLEDFEPMPEGDKQRRNLSYATEALKLWFERLPDVYVSGNLFIRYEVDGAEKRIAPDIFVVFGTSKEDRISYSCYAEVYKTLTPSPSPKAGEEQEKSQNVSCSPSPALGEGVGG